MVNNPLQFSAHFTTLIVNEIKIKEIKMLENISDKTPS